VLIVGGGIYGLTIACDAAQRGLAVALIERSDFGSGTSFNHLRTIHGGLRYLQTLDLPRARESIRERRALARIAPWAVRPLPFVLPLQRSLTRGTMAMRIGFMLDAIVAADRNEQVPTSHRLPRGQVIDPAAAVKRFPELAGMNMTGAAVWYDYVATDADRLTLSWGLAAAESGAVLTNYVEAKALLVERDRVTGVSCTDCVSGERFDVRARTCVNATGANINALLKPSGPQVSLPLLQALNFVTRRPAPQAAIGGRGPSERNLFLVPWLGRALFGTWESSSTVSPEDRTVDDRSISQFLAELNQAFPSQRLSEDDVTLVHRGVVPARVRADGTATLERHERVFEHRADGLAGLISVAGTKYTTARSVAERVVDRLFALLGSPRRPSVSATRPLPYVDLQGDDLLAHAAEHEAVVTLADAVMRRTTIGALGSPEPPALRHAADVVGTRLGWAASRRAEEVAATQSIFASWRGGGTPR
jgi:glycerol-3-phosphate dehydrogenase